MNPNLERGPLNTERPKLLLSGLDSLYVSYFLNIGLGRIDWDQLAYEKERVRRCRGEEHAEMVLGVERFALLPYGRKPYPFVLKNKNYEIRLAEHVRPACHVQIFSEALWKSGTDAVLARIEDWFRSMGLTHVRPNVVSRADWAFDYHLPRIDFAWDDFVSVATKENSWRKNRETETFTFGIGDPVIRVYDKSAEIAQESGKTWFHELWGRKSKVWRIEFQLRRRRLHEAGIDSTADLVPYQGDVLRELAQRHTTLRAPSADTNRSRWPFHPLWRALLSDIAELPQTGLVRSIDERAPVKWRIRQLCKSQYGGVRAIAALLQITEGASSPMSFEEALAFLPKLLASHHDPVSWDEEIARRVAAFGLGRW
jgi:hypothetical protein